MSLGNDSLMIWQDKIVSCLKGRFYWFLCGLLKNDLCVGLEHFGDDWPQAGSWHGNIYMGNILNIGSFGGINRLIILDVT